MSGLASYEAPGVDINATRYLGFKLSMLRGTWGQCDQLTSDCDQLVPLLKVKGMQGPVVEKAGGGKGLLQVIKPGEHHTITEEREINLTVEKSSDQRWRHYSQHNAFLHLMRNKKSFGLCIMQSPSSPMELTSQLAFFSRQNSKEHVDHIVPGTSKSHKSSGDNRRCTDLSGTQWTSLWTQSASSCR